jgi:hypothetical protein
MDSSFHHGTREPCPRHAHADLSGICPLAVLAAPSLVQAGVMKITAHLFILYFGMPSMITPPVALAAFAAANISKAGPMEIG